MSGGGEMEEYGKSKICEKRYRLKGERDRGEVQEI